MKRIALCTDGTWNRPDQRDRGRRKPSNVVKIARGILPSDEAGTPQLVYYGDGLGSRWGIDRIAAGGLGIGLSANIVAAYQFLVLNYEPGDEIFLFGFSRGAYTARSLAGLLHKIGILPKDHAFYVSDGYALYRRDATDTQLDAFRREHGCRPGPVRFVGVWDTVGALGIPVGLFRFFNRRYGFHEVGLTPNIGHAYHALAIDERRRPFEPSLWELPEGSQQTLEQVWFPGVHTNVGGGYDRDGLANGALHWIKRAAARQGLAFDETFLRHYRPWHGHELRRSLTPLYRLLGPRSRMIGATARGNEAIHPSAVRRLEGGYGYAPANLRRALVLGVPVADEMRP